MKRATFVLALLAITATAFASETAPKRDYSRDAMFRFTQEYLRQREAERLRIDFGAIDVFKFGVHFRMLWLPFLAPIPGSRLSDQATFPDAFSLTNTRIARSMPYMPDDTPAAVRREIRRVQRLEKRARVKVEPQ